MAQVDMYWPEDGADDMEMGPSDDLKITNLLRTLDLSKPRVREITSAAVQNMGTENATVYYYPIDSVYVDKLAHITAENRKTKEALEITKDNELLHEYVPSHECGMLLMVLAATTNVCSIAPFRVQQRDPVLQGQTVAAFAPQ